MSPEQWIALAGIVVTVTLAVIGYFVKRLHRDNERTDGRVLTLEQRIEQEATQQDTRREGLRNEFNAALLTEECRRKEAIMHLETRTDRMFERVIELGNSQHAETKADLRVVQSELSKLTAMFVHVPRP